MSKKIATCVLDWMAIDPRVSIGRQYTVVREFFDNGEGQLTLFDEEEGKLFTVPDVFFDVEEKK